MDWSVALPLALTFAFLRGANAHLAYAEPVAAGTIDGVPRWYAGTVRVDSDPGGRMLGYLLEAEAGPGIPAPAPAYKLVVAGKGHAPRIGGLEGKTIHIFGSVGERADGLYLFVEDLTEKEKTP